MRDFRMDTFLTVCSCMNFTKAAALLHITQPAVSQHIRYLEEYYGTGLIRFEGRQMFLTDAGEYLRRAATTMKNDDGYLQKHLASQNPDSKSLIFGATLTIGEYVMAGQLKKYMAKYPGSTIQMSIGNTRELLDMLLDGKIDFAIVEGNFPKGEYDYLTFSRERYIPVCGEGYSFQKEPEKMEDILSERLIVREEGSGTREILEKNLEARNLTIHDFRNMIEIGGMQAIKSLVEEDCGITFLYEAAVKKELEDKKIREIRLSDFYVTHDFAFIWNKGSVFTDNYRQLCQMLKDMK